MAESTEDLPLLFLPTRQVSGASLNQPESRNRRKFSSRSFIEGRLLIELASNMRLVGLISGTPQVCALYLTGAPQRTI